MKELREILSQGLLDIIRRSLFSSRLQSKNIKIKIHRTIILSVVLYGYEAWSLTLKK